ncbi:hypothetical protein [Crocinitomix catalasitica]|uniref:hypothetical protein n=1 Tax=Crocinitomix catalasitica TaxID=184607 RepID=UPI0004820CD1|nr:hypothetical protein [Crocinitomix catalasitica]
MTNINWNTTELKLDRLNVKFDYDGITNRLRIGGINKLRIIAIYVGIPLFLLIITGGIGIFNLTNGMADFKVLLIVAAMLLASIYGFFTVRRLIESNKNSSILSRGIIQIKGDDIIELKSHYIDKFDFEIDSAEKQGFHGIIKVYSHNSEEYKILGLMSDDGRLLRDDLAYLVKFFNQLVLSQ